MQQYYFVSFNIVFQLTKRPLKLHLLPADYYPTNRLLDSPVDHQSQVFVVQDMPEIAKYVFDYYLQRVQELKLVHQVCTYLLRLSIYTSHIYL